MCSWRWWLWRCWWCWNIISKLSDAFLLSPVVRVATGPGSAVSLLPVHRHQAPPDSNNGTENQIEFLAKYQPKWSPNIKTTQPPIDYYNYNENILTLDRKSIIYSPCSVSRTIYREPENWVLMLRKSDLETSPVSPARWATDLCGNITPGLVNLLRIWCMSPLGGSDP